MRLLVAALATVIALGITAVYLRPSPSFPPPAEPFLTGFPAHSGVTDPSPPIGVSSAADEIGDVLRNPRMCLGLQEYRASLEALSQDSRELIEEAQKYGYVGEWTEDFPADQLTQIDALQEVCQVGQ
jgi:hypothetical protein